MTTPRKRNRRQTGWVELNKKTKPYSWYARYPDWNETRIDKDGRVRPKQPRVLLGYKTADDLPTKGAAEEKWEQIRPRYLTSSHRAGAQIPTLAEFVWQKYHPMRSRLKDWKKSTDDRFRYGMSFVLPELGSKRLNAITTSEMQEVLIRLAQRYCHDSVVSVMTYLRAIYQYAVDEELVTKNSAKRLVKPSTREVKRPYLTLAQMAQLESILDGQDRLIVQLLSRCGFRAGEAMGLRCCDLRPDGTILIQRSVSKGNVGTTKTRGSATTVAVPELIFQELLQLRTEVEHKSPEGWLFPSQEKRGKETTPMCPDNWRKRVLQPAAKKLGFHATLQMFRRGFATIAHDAGGTVKNIQRQLRHSKSSTTMDVYIQSVEESVKVTAENMDSRIRAEVSKLTKEVAKDTTTTPPEIKKAEEAGNK